MYKVYIREPEEAATSLAVLLPGRGQPAVDLLARYDAAPLPRTYLIAAEPFEEWYPIPKGSDDQDAAVYGLRLSIQELDEFISELQEEFGLERSQIALVGFSAGGVMAIQTAAYSQEPFGAVVVHAGAILEPDELPPAKHNTPFLLIHSEDDDCFFWEERYLPMKKALMDQGYEIYTSEGPVGGHRIFSEDILEGAEFIRTHLEEPEQTAD